MLENEDVIVEELKFELEEEEEEVEINTINLDAKSIECKPDPNICKIVKDGFGIIRGKSAESERKIVHRYTLVNSNNVTVQVITYGATIISVKTPDKNGHFDDIVLGFENLEGYKNPRNPYFGSTIGRITGVIPNYTFSVGKEKHFVTNNFLDSHHSNGGVAGFDKVIWQAYVSQGKLYLSYLSEDLEEGFPGDVVINRSYELTIDNELIIETTAQCSKPTPLDISSHVDWNLSTNVGGPKELYKHYLMVNADKYAQLNKHHMITGKLKRVGRTVLDLRIPRPLGRIIHRVPGGGYDHYMNVKRRSHKGVAFAAKLTHPVTGRTVEVLTDQPGVQVYTQNNLYAQQHIIEAHPISCWCHDPLLIVEQKRLRVPVEIMDPSCYRKSRTSSELLETGGTSTKAQNADVQHTLPRNSKTYCPLQGKLGMNYVRHGGIRIVPVNYPEPVARTYNLNTFLVYPGQTYVNTTIYKFGNIFDISQKGVCQEENKVLYL